MAYTEVVGQFPVCHSNNQYIFTARGKTEEIDRSHSHADHSQSGK